MSSQVAYRLGDGAPVTIEAARAIWTAVAREVLEAATGSTSFAHSELARQVQQRSGVYTRMPAGEWLPGVVAGLGDGLAARLRPDAPPTTARTTTARTTTARTTTARPRRVRAEAPAPKRQEAPAAICPTCFTQLPVSGRCDTCA